MTKKNNYKCLLSNFIFRTNCCTNVILIVFLTFLKPIAIARENEKLKHDYLGNKIVSHREYLTFGGGIRKQRNKIVSKKSTRYPQKSLFTYPSPSLQLSKISAQAITTSGQVTQKENATEPEPKVLIAEVIVRSKKGKLEDRLENEIYRVISTKPGEKTTRAGLQKDIKAISNSGFFSNVQVVTEYTPSGVRVNFIVQPNPVLTKVEIQANPGTDIPSVLPFNITDEVFRKQYGSILNLRDLQEGIKQLTKRYNDEGYVLANVIGSPKVSESGVVTLQVAEGVIEKIQVRFFNKNESATYEKGKPIKGVTPVKEILSTFQSKPGQIFQYSLIQKDLQRLYQLGIAEELSISLEPSKQDPQKVVVVINVINELITEWNVWTRKALEAVNAARANEYETAVKHYKELLEIFRINKLQEKEALTLNNLANLYRKSEKYLLAFDTYKDSLHILRNKAPFLEIVILINMAQVSYQLKKPEQAIDIYKEALSKIRELKNNPGTTNIFGSLGEVFEDDLKSLVPGYLTIAEIALTLDLTSTYITRGDYQQAIYASNNNLNNSRNLVDVWANIVNNYLNSNFESFLDESEEGELLKIVPLLAQAFSKTPEIYFSSILRFAYSDLGYESKAKIYEQQSKIVTQEVFSTSLASLNQETINSSNPYIKLITNTIIFFLKDNKTEQEGQKITQEILSLLENKMDVDDSDSMSKELSSIIKSLVPVVIGSLTGIDQNKNTVILAEDYLKILNTIETEELDISEINEENNTDIKKTIIKSLAFNKMLTLSTIGNAYFNLGEKQKAVEYYNKAINTSDIDIVFSKQNLQLFKKYEQNPEQLSQLNQFMQIMQEMQIALKLNPKQRNEILSDFSIKLQKIY
ncbi:MAG: POTRA domain-containing protein, partial [Rivularia sp. (in: cyanobacteria)]